MTIYIDLSTFLISIALICAIILIAAFVKHMKNVKDDVLPYTFVGFVMMFKSMAAQLIMLVTFVVIPTFLTLILMMFQVIWCSYFASLVMALTTTIFLST
uniref:IMV membrane protein n=1 Tax=Panagrellus redivivus TaxID=6233 RepID=A0A7E4VLH5_PANRE